MKSTGITRRIDDLGRIVIPKEIRKNLKIKENEVLEIFIENENIILKKYSSFNDMENLLNNYVEVLEDITLNNVLITNRDKVISVRKSKEYDYLNREIGSIINKVIESKQDIKSKEKEKIEIIYDNEITTNYYISPILNNGDVLGTIIVFGNNNIDEKIINYVDVIKKLIVNYIA